MSGAQLKGLCEAVGIGRATAYRRRRPLAPHAPSRPRPRPPRALSPEERAEVLDTLHSERFIDRAPEAIAAILLEENTYLCSARTMYRILAEHDELRERRHVRRHPKYKRPELMTTAPRQTWSWDVTYLKGPTKGVHYPLYAILDLYSRYLVGWLLAQVESAELAEQLIEETYRKEGVAPGELTLHADRGPIQIASDLDALFRDLGIRRSHSRPRVSDDNPFSEAQFRTLKYHATYPKRFESFEHARAWCRTFIPWYNHEHRHSGLAFLTPAAVHHGEAEALLEAQHQARLQAYAAHPERFVHGPPALRRLPEAVYINPPTPASTIH